MVAMGDMTVTIEAEPALHALIRELTEEQRQCREYLGRLVKLEEERLQGEQRMEAFISQFEEGGDQPQPEIDDDLMKRFFVKVDGRFGVNEPDGTQRDATPTETEFVRSHIKPAKRDH